MPPKFKPVSLAKTRWCNAHGQDHPLTEWRHTWRTYKDGGRNGIYAVWICKRDEQERKKATGPDYRGRKSVKQSEAIRANPTVYIYRRAKLRAKQRGIPFDIELSDIVVPEFCPDLGIKLEAGEGEVHNSPSLDRIDPVLGYVKGNVRVISFRANTMKSNATPEELRTFCENTLRRLDQR